jgi:hypothetical protein
MIADWMIADRLPDCSIDGQLLLLAAYQSCNLQSCNLQSSNPLQGDAGCHARPAGRV